MDEEELAATLYAHTDNRIGTHWDTCHHDGQPRLHAGCAVGKLVREVRRLRAELAQYANSPGRCDQDRHMADAAVQALKFPGREEVSPSDILAAVAHLEHNTELFQRGYDLIGACDISNYLARCAEAGKTLQG